MIGNIENLRRKAELLLERCENVVLASVDEGGFPRSVPMYKVKAEGISTLWFATGTHSEKTDHFRVDPKAGVCFQEGNNSVVLTGEIEVVTDPGVKRHYRWIGLFSIFPGVSMIRSIAC